MRKKLEDIAKEVNKIVNKKIRKKNLDITEDLDNIISKLKPIKEELNNSDSVELRYTNYLIDMCEDFKITVIQKEITFNSFPK